MSNPRTRPRIWRLAALSPVVFCLLLKSMAQAQPAPSAADERGIPVPGVVFEQRRDEMTGAVVITPSKNGDPLNGVTTFDLVLINRHILALEPLQSGFDILAGDANMSNTLTTFDMVELRKLILGIYDELPLANSWRFIDKDLKSAVQNAVQNSQDPFIIIGTPQVYGAAAPPDSIPAPNWFADEEFDEFALPPMSGLDSRAEFVGFKVGDVNGSALPNGDFRPDGAAERAESLLLGMRAVGGRAGDSLEIPVLSLFERSLFGWQMALRFDTSLLAVSGVRWPADIPHGAAQDRGWHLARPGELRLLWHDAEGSATLAPGSPLFFVRASLKRAARPGDPLLRLDGQGGIPNEAYGRDRDHLGLRLDISDLPLLAPPAPAPTVPAFRLSAYPNPAGNHFRLEIEAGAGTAALLAVRDVLGREAVSRPLALEPGMNTVSAAQLPPLAPGQYFVSLYLPTGVETLRLVKQ